MSRSFLAKTVFSLGLMALLPMAASAANFIIEARPNFTFSPSTLTIQVGDTVTFNNVGGLHNVNATGASSFRCANGCDDQGGDGTPASGWSFTRTFNNAGTVNYLCQVHGASMSGVITVVGGGNPGSVALGAASFSRAESGDHFNVTVVRSGGDDGAVSVDYATSDGSATAGADYGSTSGNLSFADNEDGTKTLAVPVVNDTEDENDETLNFSLSNVVGGTLGAPSVATLTINDDDTATAQPGTLSFTSATYQAAENAGTATITVQRTGGGSGAVGVTATWAGGSAVAGSDFVPGSTPLNWGDGDSANKSFQITLADDTISDGTKTVNITLANPSGGAGLGTSSATLNLTDNDQAVGCVANATTLCLGVNGRFEVKVMWVDFVGQNGDGQAVNIGKRDSALFYFFDENNIEMLIKVLDGCGLNNRYWLFYAATTNVGFHLMVRDTVTGFIKPYTNDLGNPAAPVLDTDMEACQ